MTKIRNAELNDPALPMPSFKPELRGFEQEPPEAQEEKLKPPASRAASQPLLGENKSSKPFLQQDSVLAVYERYSFGALAVLDRSEPEPQYALF
ncbi:hypothetical protein VTI28DRAFT_7013 [Corynascus sepedonium]